MDVIFLRHIPYQFLITIHCILILYSATTIVQYIQFTIGAILTVWLWDMLSWWFTDVNIGKHNSSLAQPSAYLNLVQL